MAQIILTTPRLILRYWEEKDNEPFIRMNADPEVMKFFPSIRSREETLDQVKRIQSHFRDHGYGFYAVEQRSEPGFIGFIGFDHPGFESYFTPCVEIGWRLGTEYWGKGLATEGARACIEHGFKALGFTNIYSFTSVLNLPSARVMEKAGMQFEGHFEHPLIREGDKLRTHVLFKVCNTGV